MLRRCPRTEGLRRLRTDHPRLRTQHVDHPPARVKNNRLAAVGFVWAFAAIPRPGRTKDHYERRRALGDRHAAALGHLFNRFLGQLWHCLQTEQTYNESKAWNSVRTTSEPNAA